MESKDESREDRLTNNILGLLALRGEVFAGYGMVVGDVELRFAVLASVRRMKT